MGSVIWWIRRDLRLSDNQVLEKAIQAGEHVIPLFIIDPVLLKSDFVGQNRIAFLWRGLAALNESLNQRGSRLIIRQGSPIQVLPQVVTQVDAAAVFAEEDYSPYAKSRDQALKERVLLKLVPSLTYHHPQDVLKDDGEPYTVFTPYKNKWLERPLPRLQDLIPAPDKISTPEDIESEPQPEPPDVAIPFPAGENEAQQRLEQFAQDEIFAYQSQRDIPAEHGTSQLSPYLRFGMISARRAVATAVAARARAKNEAGQLGAQTWLTELIWREFYNAILYHFPHVLAGNFRPKYDDIQWENDEAQFEAWQAGKTGYPIVDAAMRQLKEMGWMHNRARMIVASFLVKDLLIHWQWGEKHFMQYLADGDPAANNGGWQWSAGTGTDAAPYFRIFNPTTQGEKHDPKGTYIRRYVPELAKVPDKFIHEPARMSQKQQEEYHCVIGQDYPAPIVDHKAARQRTLEAYKSATG